MANISTTYMGLSLKSPVIVGSSPLTQSVDDIRRLEEAGAGAVVLKSLFEEQILMDVDALRVNNISGTFSDTENYFQYFEREKSIGEYLQLIKDAKKAVDIPVIASINCVTAGEWVTFAQKVQKAGADALELNIFNLPADEEFTGHDYEQTYFDIVNEVSKLVNLPIAIKLSSYFSGFANFAVRLDHTKVDAMVLFNRFYEPDVNIEKVEITTRSFRSISTDNSQVLRWLGILSPLVKADLCASTGIVDGETLIKNMLVGANAGMVVSQILKEGPGVITKMNDTLSEWMDKHGMENTGQFIGQLDQKSVSKPTLFERSQFMRYFHDSDYVK
jgi:dihydroorotate dehydrogenase (fumarate)